MDQLVKSNATLGDTVELIRNRINADYQSPFIKKLVAALYSPDPVQFSKNLFNYVCRNVKYKLDPRGNEFVYKGSTTVANGIGDCKKMSVLIGSALKAYGIDPLLKHVFYSKGNGKFEDYTHIYPIMPKPGGGYIVLDPVNDQKYNSEVKHDYANVYDLKGKKMELFTGAVHKYPTLGKFSDAVNISTGDIQSDLETITGCTQRTTGQVSEAIINALTEDPTISGTGKRAKKTKEERKENRKKALEKFKKVAAKGLGAGMRGAFLVVLALNVKNIAKKLNVLWAKDPKKVETFWNKFGGDPLKLKKVMLEGTKKSPTMGSAFAAAAATALPIITAVIKMLKDNKVLTPKEGEDLEELEENAEEDVSSGKVDPEAAAKEAPKDKGEDLPKPPTAGTYWINQLATTSDWIGAALKIGIVGSVAVNSLPVQYQPIGSALGALLFLGYIVKLKLLK